MVYLAMVIVGISAAQLVWAVLPIERSAQWTSVLALGTLGAVVGGVLVRNILQHANSSAVDFHPLSLVGSVLGTVALVSVQHLTRRDRF